MSTLHRKSIIQKTIQVGSSTIVSRFFGVAREILLTNYLGASAAFDAFVTAFKIPNSLRKIFAEGALSASFVPTLVAMVRVENREQVNSFLTRSFIIIEGLLFGLCLFIYWQAPAVIHLTAPGWFVGGNPAEQVAYAISFLRILIAFILFVSSSALLAAALQSVNHFFVPAFSPIVLNIFFIAGTLVGWLGGLSPEVLCFFILFGGLVQFLIHLAVYFRLGFGFSLKNDATSDKYLFQVFAKFLPCLFSMSMMEISLFIDTSFASYLPAGSISLIYLGHRFNGIALGVFAVALSTILLPHFSRISTYAPKRLSFYLLEATKLVFWVTVPVVIMMSFFAEKIFHTLFLSSKFTISQVTEAGHILTAFLLGLFFFSLNKIILSIYYSLHNTRTPGFISFAATLLNIGLNMLFITNLKATGLALATTISGITQTLLFILFLRIHFNFRFYFGPFFTFMGRYLVQLVATFSIGWVVYHLFAYVIAKLPASLAHFFLFGLGFWMWVGPLCGLLFLAIYYLRKRFNVVVYFLE